MMKGKLAVVGCGNWGKNLVRNFCQLLGAERVICCDQRPDVLERLTAEYPGVVTATDVGAIWKDRSIAAVAIATPALTHYSLAREALLAEKDVFVEKPLATSTAEASDLCSLAEREKRVLMVDHLLLFHPAVQELERVVLSGELGEVYHLYSRRTNLGVVRSEENALWSLGPHDIAVMLRIMRGGPIQTAAQGIAYLQPHLGVQDVVFVTLVFPGRQVAHLHLSWHDPRKTREITVVGSHKMAVFDDTEPVNKLLIYDRGVEPLTGNGNIYLHDNGSTEPPLAPDEPLLLACQHFLAGIEKGHVSLSDGKMGLDVVRVLEAAQWSLERHGAPVELPREAVRG